MGKLLLCSFWWFAVGTAIATSKMRAAAENRKGGEPFGSPALLVTPCLSPPGVGVSEAAPLADVGQVRLDRGEPAPLQPRRPFVPCLVGLDDGSHDGRLLGVQVRDPLGVLVARSEGDTGEEAIAGAFLAVGDAVGPGVSHLPRGLLPRGLLPRCRILRGEVCRGVEADEGRDGADRVRPNLALDPLDQGNLLTLGVGRGEAPLADRAESGGLAVPVEEKLLGGEASLGGQGDAEDGGVGRWLHDLGLLRLVNGLRLGGLDGLRGVADHDRLDESLGLLGEESGDGAVEVHGGLLRFRGWLVVNGTVTGL